MTTTTRRPTTSRPPGQAPARRRTGAAGTPAAPAKPAKPAEPAARTRVRASPAAPPATKPTKQAKPDKSRSGKAGKAGKAPARTAARTRSAARRPASPPRAPFVLLICGLLGGALVSLLLLNTVLAEDAFTMSRLQQSNKLLGQQKEALQEEIAREEAPGNLSKKAESLGYRGPGTLPYVDPTSQQVIGGSGKPMPASAAAAAAAAGALGIPGAVLPDDVPAPAADRGAAGTGAQQPRERGAG
ncbi:hypothetical protein [Spirillospora sp. NPDC029432]|uniref:hypothetical protein n=1 Tax=Spirillospora sp. NPDC029432 TaxID=3154599 RepID=UPI00345441BA